MSKQRGQLAKGLNYLCEKSCNLSFYCSLAIEGRAGKFTPECWNNKLGLIKRRKSWSEPISK